MARRIGKKTGHEDRDAVRKNTWKTQAFTTDRSEYDMQARWKDLRKTGLKEEIRERARTRSRTRRKHRRTTKKDPWCLVHELSWGLRLSSSYFVLSDELAWLCVELQHRIVSSFWLVFALFLSSLSMETTYPRDCSACAVFFKWKRKGTKNWRNSGQKIRQIIKRKLQAHGCRKIEIPSAWENYSLLIEDLI